MSYVVHRATLPVAPTRIGRVARAGLALAETAVPRVVAHASSCCYCCCCFRLVLVLVLGPATVTASVRGRIATRAATATTVASPAPTVAQKLSPYPSA